MLTLSPAYDRVRPWMLLKFVLWPEGNGDLQTLRQQRATAPMKTVTGWDSRWRQV
jgi:hypothetical protein